MTRTTGTPADPETFLPAEVTPRALLAQLGISFAAVAVATLARWLLDPALGENLPFVAYYFATLLAAWLGGLWPGALSLVLGTIAGAYLFMEPRHTVHVGTLAQQLDIVRYVVVGLAISFICERLHRSRRRAELHREALRATLVSVGDAVIATDTQGRITLMNRVAESLTGWSTSDAVGQPLGRVLNIVNEHTRERAANPAQRALEEGVVVGLANHTILIARDGTERPIDDSAAPVRDENGAVRGCVLVFRDVTASRREARLTEAQKQVLEMIGREAPLSEVLAATCRLIETHAPGTVCSVLLPDEQDALTALAVGPSLPEDHLRHLQGLRISPPYVGSCGEALHTGRSVMVPDIAADERFAAEWRHLFLGIGMRACQCIPVFDSEPTALASVCIARREPGVPVAEDDAAIRAATHLVGIAITRHRQAERLRQFAAALRENERHLRFEAHAMNRLQELVSRLLRSSSLPAAMEEAIAAATALMGADMGTLQLYDARTGMLEIAASLGFDREFIEHFRRVRVLDDDVCGQAIRSGARVVVEDVRVDDDFAPHRMAAIAGHVRAVQATPLMSRTGELLGVLATHWRHPHRPGERDLHILDLYARQAAEFVERIRMETVLRETAAELSDAGRKKDEFLATLAHELRNPLAPLRSALQVMRLAGAEREPVAQARAMMERQLAQLVRLVDDLTDMSRITSGRVRPERRPVAVTEIVASAVETSRPLIEQMNHRLTVVAPDEPIQVEADLTRMAQVIVNLLNNAAKYSERGGHIALTVRRQGGSVLIAVRDEGVGIAPERLRDVFDMFTQVDRSLDKAQGGLGIGLALAKRLVEMHEGTIEARSDGPGRGAEFVIRLPILADATAPLGTGQEEMRQPDAMDMRRVLIVDDNVDCADSLAMMLKIMGNDTRIAYDGEEGLAAAERFRPDVVLLDIGLPKLSGYEVCHRIRALPWGREVLIIAVTGFGREDDRRRAQDEGFDMHMVKPVSPAAVAGLLAGIRRTPLPPAAATRPDRGAAPA